MHFIAFAYQCLAAIRQDRCAFLNANFTMIILKYLFVRGYYETTVGAVEDGLHP